MNTILRSRLLILSGFGASLILVTAFVLVMAGSAIAGPQAKWVVYLPHVSSPPEPIESYETNFEDSIEPWEAVRWQKGADFAVEHNSGCDSGHCGFLDFKVNTTQSYAYVSPLIEGPEPPYTIMFRAKQNDLKDQIQYGMVFGADWQDGPCPGDNTDSCFNHYYEFRVRHRVVGGDKYVQYRIRRIDGMDDENIERKGETLLDWTRAQGVDVEGWIEWEVYYGASGDMIVKANGQQQERSARDDKYSDYLYFSVGVRAGPNGDVEARYDKFSIAK